MLSLSLLLRLRVTFRDRLRHPLSLSNYALLPSSLTPLFPLLFFLPLTPLFPHKLRFPSFLSSPVYSATKLHTHPTTMSRYFTRIPSLWARAKQLTYGRNFSSKFDASDALLSDITHSILLSGVSKNLGVKYLSQPTDAEKQITYKTKGIMHGKARRVMVPFVVSTKSGISRWIIFLADTGAPQSFLSPQVSSPSGGFFFFSKKGQNTNQPRRVPLWESARTYRFPSRSGVTNALSTFPTLKASSLTSIYSEPIF